MVCKTLVLPQHCCNAEANSFNPLTGRLSCFDPSQERTEEGFSMRIQMDRCLTIFLKMSTIVQKVELAFTTLGSYSKLNISKSFAERLIKTCQMRSFIRKLMSMCEQN